MRKTYHSSISALRTEGTYICYSASGESIGEDDQADTIDPAEVQDQWSKETDCEVVHYDVDAEPQGEHLKISLCAPSMLLLREHSRDAAGLWNVNSRSVLPDGLGPAHIEH